MGNQECSELRKADYAAVLLSVLVSKEGTENLPARSLNMSEKKKYRRRLCLYFPAMMIIMFSTSIIYERSLTPSIQGLLANFTGPTSGAPPTPPTQCTPHDPFSATTSRINPYQTTEFPDSLSLKQEVSCLSRKESTSYIRHSPHKPSPYLLSKLRNYEELHHRCGAHTAAYDRSIKVLAELVNASSTECRYIVYNPVNGLGNRMITLASTFLYALLTDRVLFLNISDEMSGLFCEPFPYSSWILPSDFPAGKEDRHETFDSLMESYQNNSDPAAETTANITLPLPPFMDVNVRNRSITGHTRFFHCDEGHHLLNKVPVLHIVSDLYFIPSLFMTPSFMEELDKMFPQKEAVFHHLARYLFHPSDEAWELIKNFYDANMAKADEKVGLQIHVFKSQMATHEDVMDHVLSCTQEHNILPKASSLSSRRRRREPDTYKSIMVASLYPDYAKNLSRMYGPSKRTIYGEVIEIYQASQDLRQRSHNFRHNLQAWVEMYLLSLSDHLVTTSNSTFGYVAQGLGGLRPWVLMNDRPSEKDPVCLRAPTIDPCFHAPPRFDCKAGKMVNSLSSLFSFIKICKDRPNDGIRLSDQL